VCLPAAPLGPQPDQPLDDGRGGRAGLRVRGLGAAPRGAAAVVGGLGSTGAAAAGMSSASSTSSPANRAPRGFPRLTAAVRGAGGRTSGTRSGAGAVPAARPVPSVPDVPPYVGPASPSRSGPSARNQPFGTDTAASRARSSEQRAVARSWSSLAQATACGSGAVGPPASAARIRRAAYVCSRRISSSRSTSSCRPPGRRSRAATEAAYSSAPRTDSRRANAVPRTAARSWRSDSITSQGGISVPSRQARIPVGSRRRKTPYQPPPGSSSATTSRRYCVNSVASPAY
jgi:hypothetical protein